MMDTEGPGCITRIWTTGQGLKGQIRFYLDGAAESAEVVEDES